MALVLKKKTAPAQEPKASAFNEQEHAQDAAMTAAPDTTAPAQSKAPVTSSGSASFLKKGKAAQDAFAKEETKAQMNKDRPFRFFLKNGGESSITFLDGNLEDGALNIPYFYEHFVKISGRAQNFVCTQDEEPCPICEGGDSPSFVGVLTVIDHSSYTGKDGKEYKDQVRLFVPKRGTIKQLQKFAEKRGGLRGCRFDVSRTGDKEPAVGNVFDFTEKLTEQQLVKTYGEKAAPLDYAKALGYLPAKDLRKLGFGSMHAPIGAESGAGEDFDKQL